jgi:hypothetical protein
MESGVIGLLTGLLQAAAKRSCTGVAPKGNGTEVIPNMKAESGIMNELSDHKPPLITHWNQRLFSFPLSAFTVLEHFTGRSGVITVI